MPQRSFVFGSEAGDRIYPPERWAQTFRRLVSDGIVEAAHLEVSATSPSSMDVEVANGVLWIDGYWFEVHGGPESLTIPASDPSNPRIDRISVRRRATERDVLLAVLAGTPAATPTAPALTKTAATYEVSLAQVSVAAGATSISDANITDERTHGVASFDPRGVLGRATATNLQTDVTTEADITGLSVAVTAGPGRRLAIRATVLLEYTPGGGPNAARTTLRIKEGTTQIGPQHRQLIHTDGNSAQQTVTHTVYVEPTSGAHTYKATLESSQAVNVRSDAAISEILVEDIGPV